MQCGEQGEVRTRGNWWRLVLGAALAAPLAWVTYSGAITGMQRAWVQFALATPVVVLVGGPHFAAAWRNVRRLRPSIDVLVALIAGAIYVRGLGELTCAVSDADLIGRHPACGIPDHGAPLFLYAAAVLTAAELLTTILVRPLTHT